MEEGILKIVFHFADKDLKQEVFNELSKIETISISSSYPTNIEINDVHANKGETLEKICKYKGLSKDEVFVFGDGLNDISMLEKFPNSFAMENASDFVKSKANYVCESNNEDGVIQAIKRELIKEGKLKKQD